MREKTFTPGKIAVQMKEYIQKRAYTRIPVPKNAPPHELRKIFIRAEDQADPLIKIGYTAPEEVKVAFNGLV